MKRLLLMIVAILTMANTYATDFETIGGLRYQIDTYAKTATLVANTAKYSGDIVVPEMVTLAGIDYPVIEIGEECFNGCNSLTSIIIPSSVTSLGDWCFRGCSSLISITIPSSVTRLGNGCFQNCTSLTSIDIPSSVTSLGNSCFWDCSSLTSITIPSSVTSLGNSCFYCIKLNKINCYAINPPRTYGSLSLPSTVRLYVPASSVDKYKQAAVWKDFIAILPIPGTEGGANGKCEKPSITFTNGKLHFESSTTGASYYYTITSNDMKTDAYSESGDVTLQAAYKITAYATADDYSPSDKATATLYWVDGRIDDPTGISSTTSAKRGIVVSSQNGTVTLSGLDDGERVSFYSVSGSNLGTVKASHGVATGSFPQGQVVIVKVGKDCMKVAL